MSFVIDFAISFQEEKKVINHGNLVSLRGGYNHLWRKNGVHLRISSWILFCTFTLWLFQDCLLSYYLILENKLSAFILYNYRGWNIADSSNDLLNYNYDHFELWDILYYALPSKCFIQSFRKCAFLQYWGSQQTTAWSKRKILKANSET